MTLTVVGRTTLLVAAVVFGAWALLRPSAPTGLTGNWTFTVALDTGRGDIDVVLDQAGENLTGSYRGRYGVADLAGSVRGDAVEFAFETDETGVVTYVGTIRDAVMEGTCDYGPDIGTGTWEATRGARPFWDR